MPYVLLVEDDATLGGMVRRGLQASGYTVRWALDGDAAYDAASGGAYDAVILDVMLPGTDGLTVLRGLRDAGVRTPVLCLTSRGETGDRVAGLDAGADDYLVKPFAFEELLARLRAVLRRPGDALVSDHLRLGTLTLWPRERRAAVRGYRVDIPAREFDLLEYLARHPGRTVARDLITERIWGTERPPRANVVDATISRLRRRLTAAGWDGQIVAVPTVGYRLEERGGAPVGGRSSPEDEGAPPPAAPPP
jgi:DNA-binding response OmpR family regulator